MPIRLISASRRTDIPAFYGDWFMNRVRAGWCAVPNPFNARQVSRVEFVPGETVIVFWTRWPAPFLRHLDELTERGFAFYFLYTLVDYPRPLEPQAPLCDKSLAVFRRLAERIGPERVIWRYDPIVLSAAMDADFHRERFARIAQRLQGSTTRVVISIANHYAKLRGRLRELAAAHPELAPRPFDAGGDGGNGLGGKTASQASSGVGSETASSAGNATQSQIGRDGALIQDLAHLAGEHGLEIRGCAEEFDLRRWGVQPGKCIDDELIRRLFQLPAPTRKDKSQRAVCGCVESRDIGMYDSCLFGCVYCYATRSFATARHNHAHHDPHAESLIGDYRAPPPVTRSSAPLPSPAL